MTKLRIAEDLSLPAEAVTETFGILAVRGAGKSNTAAVMAEEMFQAKLPFVVVDPVGSWWGLRSSGDGKGPGLPLPIFGGKRGDVPLERSGGQLVADLVVDQRLSCVLDLSTFESEKAKKEFLLAFAQRLYKRNEAPLHLFLEEADDYIPQRPMGNDDNYLLRAWENIVRRGRSRGLGMTLITQRSAALNKNVLTQVQTLIAMRTTGPQDRKAIEEWVKYHDQSREILESLSGLRDGEAWVWSPDFLRKTVRVRFRRRATYDSGATPKLQAARAPATLADVDIGKLQQRMAATIEKAKQEDPRELRRRIAELERAARTQKPPAAAPATKVQEVVKRVEVPVLKDQQFKRLEGVSTKLVQFGERLVVIGQDVVSVGREITAGLAKLSQPANGHARPVQPQQRVVNPQPRSRADNSHSPPARRAPPADGEFRPSSSQQRILNSLAFAELIGISPIDKTQLALLSDASPTSGGYFNNLGVLRTAGLVEYPTPGSVSLSEAGRGYADPGQAPQTDEDLQRLLFAKLSSSQVRIVEELIREYPKDLSKDELADRTGQSATSGGYFNNLGRLRSLGLIDYPTPGRVGALPVLFLEAGGR